MTAKEIINKLKETKNDLPSFGSIKLGMTSLEPAFSISNSILKTKQFIDEGIDPSFSELLLPHLATTFGPPLIANSVYSRFKFTQRDLLIYAVGFVLSLFLHSNSYLMYFINEVPYISKFFSLIRIKNSAENTFSMFCWIITCEIAGMLISKSILKKKLKIKTSDIMKMIVTYGGVFILRIYSMPDYYVIIVANIMPLSLKAIELLRTRNDKNNEKEEKEQVNEEEEVKEVKKKTTKRKASVASKLKNK